MNDPQPYLNALILTDDIYCLSYLAGFIATSMDQYQVNITCKITSTNQFTLSVTVHSNTKITSLQVYILLFDRT